MFKEKKSPTVIALIVLLVLALGYIVGDKYLEGRQEKLDSIYAQGYNAGAARANQLIMNQIMADLNTQGATAITVPVSENQSVTVPLIMERTFIGSIVAQLNQEGKFSFNTIDQSNQSVTVDLIMPQMCGQLQAPAEQ